MSLRLKPAEIVFAIFAILGFAGTAGAASVVGVFPFQNTGASPPGHYGDGAYPESELLQASDGNFYGTTSSGGSGECDVSASSQFPGGCGTIFRINAATGTETVLFNFPSDLATRTAPDGAAPRAGLIQGQDGALYGVTSEGGLPGCALQPGCGTLFRISMTGQFTLLHQFCGRTGCPGVVEGGDAVSHLVQAADGTLYGTTFAGGDNNYGTLFSASTSGVVKTLHYFEDASDGYEPAGALLIGKDGSTLYGTVENGGAAYGGVVFSYGVAGLTIIHSFGETVAIAPEGALIYGADGLLYGTASGGVTTGSVIYSLSTTGDGFAVDTTLTSNFTETGLLLGSDGMMYGTGGHSRYGGLFAYNPTTKVAQSILAFGPNTGGAPAGALIEGKDHYLYGSNSAFGSSNSFGPAEGTLFRVGPALP